MKKIAILTVTGLISVQANALTSNATCYIENVEIKKEKIKNKQGKILKPENYVVLKKIKNRPDVLKSELGTYSIESTCSEIKSQKNSIFAAIITSYDVASDGASEWYHEETYCIFIDAKIGVMLSKKDQIKCLGSWRSSREWVTEGGELFKF